MIKEIIKDNFILSQPSIPATKEDLSIIDDLVDTIDANRDNCVGMAANMIGYLKRIIIVLDEDKYLVMINPEIIKTSKNQYQSEEGCLCHEGTRPTKRYETIKVAYLDSHFKKKIKTYTNYTAQIIQHEIDHCNGILI